MAPSLVEGLRELPEGFPCLVPTPIGLSRPLKRHLSAVVNLLEANSPLSLERDQTRSHDTSGPVFDQPRSQLNALLVAWSSLFPYFCSAHFNSLMLFESFQSPLVA